MENLNNVSGMAWDLLAEYGPNLALALVTLLTGLWVIGILIRAFRKFLKSKDVDPSLTPFFVSLFGVTLKILLVLSILGMVGVQVTSFIAILGAASLAVGLALQGSLQNFAGGVMILIFRPFKAGDFVDAMGHSGSVKSIQIFHTILTTSDNKTVIIPNGNLANSALTNFSTQPTRRLDMKFGIGYEDDVDKAKSILRDMASEESRVLKETPPLVAVNSLGDNSVELILKMWCSSGDYWDLHYAFTENVKKQFDEAGISFPYPQREVTIANPAGIQRTI